MPSENLHVCASKEDAAQACCDLVLTTLQQVLGSRPFATIAISGGTTPALLFQDLAKSDFEWRKLHVFWVDERCVPPGDSQSNYKLANDNWLAPAKVPAANIHRIHGEVTPDEAAITYIEEVRKVLGLEQDELPAFDVVHRGMGPDAHTASLFPGEPLIANETGIAAAVWVEKMNSHRVTLLPGVLRKAATTVLQVAGADKADALEKVLRGPADESAVPCQIGTRDSDRAHWFLDRAAAQRL